MLEEQLNAPLKFDSVRPIGGNLVNKISKMGHKILVMKRKSCLRNAGIWIEEDYTPRQIEVQEYIGRVAE